MQIGSDIATKAPSRWCVLVYIQLFSNAVRDAVSAASISLALPPISVVWGTVLFMGSMDLVFDLEVSLITQ